MTLTNDYDDFLDFTGREDRAGQREAVRLLVELSRSTEPMHYALSAPTGTGKSYAALIAGVTNARRGKRTVIGTSTVVLSEQYGRDMQDVASVFTDVSFALLKGASNYYCGNKVAEELKLVKSAERKKTMMGLLVGYKKGSLPSLPVWAVADPDYCANCAEKLRRSGKSECEYAVARAAALKAQVVVTTHAMIHIDMRMRKGKGSEEKSGVLGDIWLTIFDEAHKAADTLSYDDTFGMRAIRGLDFNGVLNVMPFAKRSKFVEHFDKMTEDGWSEEHKWIEPTPHLAYERMAMWPTMSELRSMSKVIDSSVSDKDKFKLYGYLDFLRRGLGVLEQIGRGESNGDVGMWVRGGSYKLREMVPDEELVTRLSGQRVAWMSATIGTRGRPKYSLDKCGFYDAKLFKLESPFDYAKQLSWTVRTEGAVGNEIELLSSINSHWKGGMVVLTPFHKRKERIAERLAALGGGLVQQQASGTGVGVANAAAVKSHCEAAELGGSPVLVGVEVFSTGIDLPGERLTKLVVAGLFPLRDDLGYIAWRGRWLEAVGGNGFDGYELPERAIALEQQIGRVIRRVDDTGVVVFYVEDKDWKHGSKGKAIIEEALARFPGVVGI